MNSSQVNQNNLPFPWFPKTNPPLSGGSQSGVWDPNSQNTLVTIAQTLQYSGNVARINSLPTAWSRACQLEQAITNTAYPTKADLLNELFGCLACIGLSKSHGLNLEATPISLENLASSNSAKVAELANILQKQKPEDRKALFKYPNIDNSWDKFYILGVDRINIGFTSPLTLVCPTAYLMKPIPGMEGWTSSGRFTSPVQHLGNTQKQQLADWLLYIGQSIGSDNQFRNNNNSQMLNSILQVLQDFSQSLGVNPSGSVTVSSEPANGFPLRGPKAITALARPIECDPSEAKSQATIILGERLKQLDPKLQKPLILLDPEMGDKLAIPAQDLVLYGSATAQSTGYDKSRLENQYPGQINIIDIDDIFLPELHLLSSEEALIKEATWLPSCYQGIISVDGLNVTPLLPFKEGIRDLYSSTELSRMCSMRVTEQAGEPAIELKLLVNIEGLDVPYPVTKIFPIRKKNIIIDAKPVITIWPYVTDEIWREFYIFTQMSRTGLVVDGYADYQGMQELNVDTEEHVRYYKTKDFPDLLKLSKNGQPQGIIPLKIPARPTSTLDRWQVGFDFGTSFTNFAIDNGVDGARRMPLKTYLMPVTNAEGLQQQELLYDFFVPQTLYPQDENPPTATALHAIDTKEIPSLFHEARIQWPSPESQVFQKGGLRTGFKWDQQQYQHPFILQLAMLISVNAVAENASGIDWHVSYPSAFTRRKSSSYLSLWEDLCKKLVPITGLDHKLHKDKNNRGIQTEAVAFAKYFGNYLKEYNLSHTACMDVGGGTTDISIWQDNECIHQVSVKFAGRNICTNLLGKKMSITEILFADEFQSLRPDSSLKNNPNLNSWLDNILRNSTETLYEKIRLGCEKTDAEGKALQRLISLIALAYGGLYYYIGIILKSLAQDGELRDSKNAMPVLVGGNGARFLYWIVGRQRFDRFSEIQSLFEELQKKGSGFTDSPNGLALTTISKDLKDESALGMISQNRLIEHDPDLDDSFIPGETVTIGDKVYTPLESISLKVLRENIGKTYQVNRELTALKEFVEHYDSIVENIESVLPVRKMEPNSVNMWIEARDFMQAECADLSKVTDVANIEPEPPFIIGLKALMQALIKTSLTL